ncbi:ribosyldihydronicotinamide dehydrogenase [quinone]-like isoform X1 [Monodelphis domestica]|uniref:ribosyldihydronicotinamide dehydrogenase [quinone]-like isoform X1 n=1 Tax=Monodelphis domestica TaxID=13616 RepID=UPI0024E26C51|nr:ribosyldihydronicotinamide dehydrogenase [quinone]-like isoform X1 [Monodelphis domestica]
MNVSKTAELSSMTHPFVVTNGSQGTWNQDYGGKRVLIVYAHQMPTSMNGSLKDAAVTELSNQGCQVTVSDLYSMNFEPRATRQDFLGASSNSEFFNYAEEAHEAYKKGCLSKDVVEEQKKVQEADLVIFQFPMYWLSVPAILKGWLDRVLCKGFAFDIPGYFDKGFLKDKSALLSFTTGGTAEKYFQKELRGDIKYILWPLQHGVLHFCGFQILRPQINFAPEHASESKRKEMVASWARRLETIWDEKPINCTSSWYFEK